MKRAWTHRPLLVLACLLVATAALASFSALTLSSAATQAATGNGAWIPVTTGTQLAVQWDVTAGTSITRFDGWIQGTNDSTDSTGYDVPCDLVMQSDPATAATPTITANQRNIVNNKSTTTAVRAVGIVKAYPWKYVRARWVLTGTNVTFSVTAGAK